MLADTEKRIKEELAGAKGGCPLAHMTARRHYRQLVERINLFPQAGRMLVQEAVLTAEQAPHPIHTSGFIAVVADNCTGCGQCVPVCPIKTLSLEAEGPNGFGRKRAAVDGEFCLGCGVCARNCPRNALAMQRREEKSSRR
ncbi:MAG: 4Fe-4S dicluster domain-containing protein [Desulfuromonadales bacterium]